MLGNWAKPQPKQCRRIGHRIEGSSLVLDLCKVCGEWIRVAEVGSNLCQDCQRDEADNLSARIVPQLILSNKGGDYSDDPSPGEENCVRILEDMIP